MASPKREKTRLANVYKIRSICRATNREVTRFEVHLCKKLPSGEVASYTKRHDTQRAAELDRDRVLADIREGRWVKQHAASPDIAPLVDATVAQGLARYVEYLKRTKSGGLSSRAANRILSLGHRPIGLVKLVELENSHLDEFIAQRLADGVSQSTIRKEVSDLRRFRRLAHKPAMGLGLPPLVLAHDIELRDSDHRTRRPSENELAGVFSMLEKMERWDVLYAAKLALATACRQGELCEANWQNFDQSDLVLNLAAGTTKTKVQRAVPLTNEALALLEEIRGRGGLGQLREMILGGLSAERCSATWRAACDRAGVYNLRFHDLRHEAISRLAEQGLSDRQLMVCSGHKTAAMLGRYSHLSAARLGAQLRQRRGI